MPEGTMMAVPYDALRAFVTVVQAGSFSEAARQLQVSQPWVSQRVAQLEAYLGRKQAGPLRLLERRRRGVALTPDGELLRDLAADSMAALETLDDTFDSRRGRLSGRVRLAASSTMLLYLIPESVRRFRETYPHVRLETCSTNSQTMAKQVLDDKVDLALGDPGEMVPPGVRIEVVRSSDRLLVTRVGDPLLKLKGPLTPGQIGEREWIVLPESWSLTRRKLDSLLGHYPIAMEVEHWEVMKTYVALGVGVAVMPDLCILPKDRKQLGTMPLAKEFGRSYFCLMLRKKKALSPAVMALIHMISPEVAQRVGKQLLK